MIAEVSIGNCLLLSSIYSFTNICALSAIETERNHLIDTVNT